MSVFELPVVLATESSLSGYGQLIHSSVSSSLSIPFYPDQVLEGDNIPGIKFNGNVVVRKSKILSKKYGDKSEILWLERHVQMTQGFMGLAQSPFILTLSKPTPNGNLPDLTSLKAFVVAPGNGIFLNIGTWHDFPISVQPFQSVSCLILNSKEVVDALASMKTADEMDHGDIYKIKLSKHFGSKYRKFVFSNKIAKNICLNQFIKPIHSKYDEMIKKCNNMTDTVSPYSYSYGDGVRRIDNDCSNMNKIAVIPVINIEVFKFKGGGPSIQSHLNHNKPELANSGWRDYGNRSGLWRLSNMFEELDIAGTVVMNSDIIKYETKEIVDIIRNNKKWEIAAHGVCNNCGTFADLSYENEKKEISKCLNDISDEFGCEVKTWLTPGFGVSKNTTNILSELGVKCILDFVNDDVVFKVKCNNNNEMVAIPYSMETNDISLCLTKNYNENDYVNTLKNHILEMAKSQRKNKLNVVCLGMHTFIAGVPSRIGCLRKMLNELKNNKNVWIATAEQVTDYYIKNQSQNSKL